MEWVVSDGFLCEFMFGLCSEISLYLVTWFYILSFYFCCHDVLSYCSEGNGKDY